MPAHMQNVSWPNAGGFLSNRAYGNYVRAERPLHFHCSKEIYREMLVSFPSTWIILQVSSSADVLHYIVSIAW